MKNLKPLPRKTYRSDTNYLRTQARPTTELLASLYRSGEISKHAYMIMQYHAESNYLIGWCDGFDYIKKQRGAKC